MNFIASLMPKTRKPDFLASTRGRVSLKVPNVLHTIKLLAFPSVGAIGLDELARSRSLRHRRKLLRELTHGHERVALLNRHGRCVQESISKESTAGPEPKL